MDLHYYQPEVTALQDPGNSPSAIRSLSYTQVIIGALERFPEAYLAVRQAILREQEERAMLENSCARCRGKRVVEEEESGDES